MTPSKKIVSLEPARSVRKELDRLYARRSAVDSLIESLEDYVRFKAQQAISGRRRSR